MGVRGTGASRPSDDLIWQLDEIQGVECPRKLEVQLLRLPERLDVSIFIKVSLAGIIPVKAPTSLHKLPETDMRLEESWPRIVAQETAIQIS